MVPIDAAEASDAILNHGVVIALASCQYPPDLLHERVANRSFRRMHRVLQESRFNGMLRFLLMAGDSIYADPTAGLFDPVDEWDRYEGAYRTQIASPAWRDVNTLLHDSCFAIDDHELVENWEPAHDPNTRQRLATVAKTGRRSFIENRHFLGGLSDKEIEDKRLWGSRQLGPLPFFLMDTRTERGHRTAETVGQATMIHDQQLSALLEWISDHHKNDQENPDQPSVPKVILSPSILLPRRLETASSEYDSAAIRSDAWDGYPATMKHVLAHIADNQIRNVLFLSGDEHLSCLARAQLTGSDSNPVGITSIHAPPLYGPFPFANAKPEEFVENEKFVIDSLTHEQAISISVEAQFPLVGDGFVLLIFKQQTKEISTSVEFCGLDGTDRYVL